MIEIKSFGKLELRVGTIELAEDFPEANKPAYKLKIDFGPQGKKVVQRPNHRKLQY